MSVRRGLWLVILATWPAVIAAKTIWHPAWGQVLSDCGAALTVAAGASLLLLGPERPPALRDRRTRHQVAGLERRMAAVEAGLAETRAQRASGIEGIRRALDSAGVPVPDCVTADAPTQPVIQAIGRRAV